MTTETLTSNYKQMILSDIKSLLDTSKQVDIQAGYHMGLVDEKGAEIDSTSGKMFRPTLLLSFVEALGGDVAKALPVATGIQIFQDFTLVHDDIEDNDPKRRGRDTVWTIWGIPQAINAGDFMFNLAIKSISRSEYSQMILPYLTDVFRDVCRGQSEDMMFENRKISDVSEEQYLGMIKGKSARFIEGSCGAGVMIAGRDDQLRMACSYGINMGMAYQIYDDYMGLWGQEEQTGKKMGSDIYEKKKAYPIVLLNRLASDEDKTKIEEIYSQKEIAQSDLEYIMALHEKYKTQELIRAKSLDFQNKALLALSEIETKEEWKIFYQDLLTKLMRF